MQRCDLLELFTTPDEEAEAPSPAASNHDFKPNNLRPKSENIKSGGSSFSQREPLERSRGRNGRPSQAGIMRVYYEEDREKKTIDQEEK